MYRNIQCFSSISCLDCVMLSTEETTLEFLCSMTNKVHHWRNIGESARPQHLTHPCLIACLRGVRDEACGFRYSFLSAQ